MNTLTRFEWEEELRDTRGPPLQLTRLVMAMLATYVKRKGSTQCWPSLSALETATGLSRPTIIDHINRAVELGWLRKETGQIGGMQRRGSIYTLTLPTSKPSLDRSAITQPVNLELTGQQPRPVKQTPPTGKAGTVRPVKHPTMKTSPEVEGTSISEVEGNIKDLELRNQGQNPDRYPGGETNEKSDGQVNDKSNGQVNGVRQEKIDSPVSDHLAKLKALVKPPETTAKQYRDATRGQ